MQVRITQLTLWPDPVFGPVQAVEVIGQHMIGKRGEDDVEPTPPDFKALVDAKLGKDLRLGQTIELDMRVTVQA